MASSEEQPDRLLAAALEKIPKDRPIVIFNLLRFRKEADYGDIVPATVKEISTPCSGEEAYYTRYFPAYLEAYKAFFGDKAGKKQKVLYLGKEMLPFIPGGKQFPTQEEYWHTFMVTRFLSFEAAVEFQKSNAYRGIAFHKTAALAVGGNRMWFTEPVYMPD